MSDKKIRLRYFTYHLQSFFLFYYGFLLYTKFSYAFSGQKIEGRTSLHAAAWFFAGSGSNLTQIDQTPNAPFEETIKDNLLYI